MVAPIWHSLNHCHTDPHPRWVFVTNSRTCCSLTKGKMLKESKDFVFANNCQLILQHTGWVYKPVTGVDLGELFREWWQLSYIISIAKTLFMSSFSYIIPWWCFPSSKKSWIPLWVAWWEHKLTPHKHGKTQLQVYENWITYNSVSVYSTHAHCLQLLSNSIPDTDLKIALTRSSWGKIPLHVPIHFHIRLKKKFKNISKWAIQSLPIYHTWIFQNTKIWLIFWIPVVKL